MVDRGPEHESGSHDGTAHTCITGGETTFDNGRFTECPMGCGFANPMLLDPAKHPRSFGADE